MRPVAGTDIRVGMTISLAPSSKPFKVDRIVPSDAPGLAERLVFLYAEGETRPAGGGGIFLDHWFAEVTS